MSKGVESQFSIGPSGECRIHVPPGEEAHISLIPGEKRTAEIFGSQMFPGVSYCVPSGAHVPVYSWDGAGLSVRGTTKSVLDSCYAAEVTPMRLYAEYHAVLHEARMASQRSGNVIGPRVLVAGRRCSGKNSVSKILLNYAARVEFAPVAVDLDVGNPFIGMSGNVSAATWEFPTAIDEENVHAVTLSYPFGYTDVSADAPLFDHRVETLGNIVLRRLSDNKTNSLGWSGCVINAPSVKSESTLRNIIEKFDVTHVLILHEDRLSARLRNFYTHIGRGTLMNTRGSPLTIEMLPASTGVVSSIPTNKVVFNNVRAYMHGSGRTTFNPQAYKLPYDRVELYRLVGGTLGSLPRAVRMEIGRKFEEEKLLFSHRVVSIMRSVTENDLLAATVLCYGVLRELQVESVLVEIPALFDLSNITNRNGIG
eukprot:PhF_6_TR17012/c0_g1_i1/m.25782/K14399/CLP1, HERB; polyribonucleotide 5'-hydroxyl-kinase